MNIWVVEGYAIDGDDKRLINYELCLYQQEANDVCDALIRGHEQLVLSGKMVFVIKPTDIITRLKMPATIWYENGIRREN